MLSWNRRTFAQLSAGAALGAASNRVFGLTDAPSISNQAGLLRVTGSSSVTWRFDEHGIWTEPIVYNASAAHDVVSLHYFSDVKDSKPVPSLHASYLVVPGKECTQDCILGNFQPSLRD
jgi:hypothetical protein